MFLVDCKDFCHNKSGLGVEDEVDSAPFSVVNHSDSSLLISGISCTSCGSMQPHFLAAS